MDSNKSLLRLTEEQVQLLEIGNVTNFGQTTEYTLPFTFSKNEDGLYEPKDISGIVSFLCSKDASYITGENIVVGGGIPSRL